MDFGWAGPIYGAICIGSLTCANREIGVPGRLGVTTCEIALNVLASVFFMVRQSPDWRVFGLKQALTESPQPSLGALSP